MRIAAPPSLDESECVMEKLGAHARVILDVPEALAPSIIRKLTGRTSRDKEIDELPDPSAPFWLRFAVASLRWYRRVRPLTVSQRCVWDPSCSRYAEMAFRHRGLARGFVAVLGRLMRCRPGRGGVDLIA